MSSFLDTIAGYGQQLGDAATAGLKGFADATVQAAADTLHNAGTTKSAVPETHKAVQVGENANGAPVVPLPNGAISSNGQVIAAAGSGVPVWVWVVGSLSALALVGGITYAIVRD